MVTRLAREQSPAVSLCQSMGMTVKTSSVDQDEMFGIDRFWATEKSMSLRFERDRGGTPTATIFGRHTATKFGD